MSTPALLLLVALGCGKDAPSDAVEDSAVTDSEPDSKPPDDSGDSGGDSGSDDTAADDTAADDTAADDSGEPAGPPVVILMIGDGMGPGQLEVGSYYVSGELGQLALQGLPYHAQVSTASLSGLTDSAAAATTMATGVKTWNGRIGMDPEQNELETLVELAKRQGLKTAVISTSAVTHATPAGFTAHESARHLYVEIADDQAALMPDILMGGGARYFLPSDDERSIRDDEGLIGIFEAAGCQVAWGLDTLDPAASPPCLLGLFNNEHMSFEVERTEESNEPRLLDMVAAAELMLADSPEGFLLIIEGSRIDMASHSNDAERMLGELLAFDEAVASMSAWVDALPNATLIVTADHECGGLEVVTPGEVGVLSEVSWRWGLHTNTRIDLYAKGAGAEVFDGELVDHRWVHALASSRITNTRFVSPAPMITPDGLLTDLQGPITTQTWATGFGEGYNQLDALYMGADALGLSVGLEGLFEFGENAVVLLIDVDLGEGEGITHLSGELSDVDGDVDALLTSLNLTAPGLEGFGADLAVVSIGGQEVELQARSNLGGVRGLAEPHGDPSDMFWLGGALNFGDGVRATDAAISAVSGEGFEVLIPWNQLWPTWGGGVPPFSSVAVVALIVAEDGTVSNQLLPPLVDGADNPGLEETALPGVVYMVVDSDGDGVGDGGDAPVVMLP